MTRFWKWKVTGYYSNDVESPKLPGDLAIQTVHANADSKDLEVQLLTHREDIGRIDIEPLGPTFTVEQWARENRKRCIADELKVRSEILKARN